MTLFYEGPAKDGKSAVFRGAVGDATNTLVLSAADLAREVRSSKPLHDAIHPTQIDLAAAELLN